jgi:hypothetical protein
LARTSFTEAVFILFGSACQSDTSGQAGGLEKHGPLKAAAGTYSLSMAIRRIDGYRAIVIPCLSVFEPESSGFPEVSTETP